jgi:hypothetical protein
MKLNARMTELLKKMQITAPIMAPPGTAAMPSVIVVGDSVFLREEYQKATHVKRTDFQDATGYESFINHIHLPYDRTRKSLLSCLRYAIALQKVLHQETGDFLVIVSISDNDCVVRFHRLRPNETWLAGDLEKYREEAILTLSTRESEETGGAGGPESKT